MFSDKEEILQLKRSIFILESKIDGLMTPSNSFNYSFKKTYEWVKEFNNYKLVRITEGFSNSGIYVKRIEDCFGVPPNELNLVPLKPQDETKESNENC